jgi:hypothetical protein
MAKFSKVDGKSTVKANPSPVKTKSEILKISKAFTPLDD